MIKLQLFFTLALIVSTLAQDTDKCTTGFENALLHLCQDRDGSCNYNPNFSDTCNSITNNECSKGDGDSSICSYIFHKDFPAKDCYYSNTADTLNKCLSRDLICGNFHDYINTDSVLSERDFCSSFKAPVTDLICLLDNSKYCSPFFKTCEEVPNDACQDNSFPKLLSNYIQECYWNGEACTSRDRTCDSDLNNLNEDECLKLKTSTPDFTKCVYIRGICKAMPLCEKKVPSVSSDCTNIKPLKNKGISGAEYDYQYKCTFVEAAGTTSARCEKELRKCEEYTDDDPSICISLQATDENKRCVYDERLTSNKCKEEYKTCELYSEKEINKDRDGCQKLIMNEENTKCVYNIEEDICVTERNYTSCSEYEGISQKICESIVPSAHTKCILDKDSKCKERALLCSEAFDYESCLYYATATTSNKRCVYDSSKSQIGRRCYEEYLRCEDYFPINSNNNVCSNIKLLDGKYCEWDSSRERCITKNKTCSEVFTKEECNLIAKSGVSNPDKLVCRWLEYNNSGVATTVTDPNDSSKTIPTYACRETYKYCSDYRGTVSNFCNNNIKPYNETEDKIDITLKCKYEDGRCERVHKECSEADGNPVLCALISPKIQDNDIKYCAYIGNKCETHFKKCEYWKVSGITSLTCENNKPENYLNYPCATKTVDGETICYTQKVCNAIPSSLTDYENICHSVEYDCEISSNGCTTKTEYDCDDIKFYKDSEENAEICKNKEASLPYKICTLKEDRSGCEEILNLSYTATPLDNTTPGNNASSLENRIHIILILLCLLF